MYHSRRLPTLAIGLLVLSILACAVQQTAPPVPTPTSTTLPGVTQTASAPAPTATTAAPPTVVPLVTSTLIPTPSSMPTPTATATTATAPRPAATATPSSPAAKLDFTQEDITFSLSPKRKGDDKVQLTIALHPKGGREPFSFVLDDATTYQGLTATFDWHNCGPGEPHTIVVVSGDGQRSKSIGIMFPYDC